MGYNLVTNQSQRSALVLQYVRSMLRESGKLSKDDVFLVTHADKPYTDATCRIIEEARQLFNVQADSEDGLADFYTECVYGSDTNVFTYESNGDEFFHESNRPFFSEVQE